MNIYAKKGTKVIFNHPNAGYTYQQARAREKLSVGETYIVESTDVGNWRTLVALQEIPDEWFNSVFFDEASQ